MNELPSSHYVRILRPLLPEDAFTPHAGRLGWWALHVALIVGGMVAIAVGNLPWPALLLCSVVIGHSFTGGAFVGHEVLHGAVVRSRRLSHVLGWFCLLPFTLSPTLWKAWHNRAHHGNTMKAGVDPDAYPMLEDFQKNPKLQWMDKVALGRDRAFGWICLAIGFTGQSLQVLFSARRQGYVTREEYRKVLLETLAGVAVWATLAFVLGWRGFLFAYVLPMVAANTVAMAYILTNHHLSPMTQQNDPLLNSLTVTVPSFWDVLHSSFGLHVEHHLFPAMPARHAKKVRALLTEKWPERYQTLTLVQAVRQLMRTPRVYKEATVLCDPITGSTCPTLLPRELATSKNTEAPGLEAVTGPYATGQLETRA